MSELIKEYSKERKGDILFTNDLSFIIYTNQHDKHLTRHTYIVLKYLTKYIHAKFYLVWNDQLGEIDKNIYLKKLNAFISKKLKTYQFLYQK